MKKLGETEQHVYYGRQKGISAAIEFLCYSKDSEGNRSGRPDFSLGKILKPDLKKPLGMKEKVWQELKYQEHWRLAREALCGLVPGVVIDGCSE